jgi:hypothetical protein
VLLGAAVATYLVLSLFDHAARADAGSNDQSIGRTGATDAVASVKTKVAGAGKTIGESRSIIPKSTVRMAHRLRIHRSTDNLPKIHLPKIQASSKARTAVVRQKLPAAGKLLSLPDTATLPDLPQAELPASPSWPQLPGSPLAQLRSWPQPPDLLRARPLWWPELPRLPQAGAGTTALLSVPLPHQPRVTVQLSPLPQPPGFASAPSLSGVAGPPAAQAQPRTAPPPAPPRQPADRSAPTGQARDTDGGHAPATGTVSSSWRPEVAVVGHRMATDLIARGRTVRYAGPPS